MNPEKSQTCLVTGALGFIGSHAVTEFARAGWRVIGVGRERLLGDAEGLSAYTSMELPSPDFDALVAAEQPDAIVHTAGPASVAGSIENPAADFAGTVDVLGALLETVRTRSPQTRVVIVSSAAVYGNPTSLPVAESASLAPMSPYGFHKQIAETLLAEYSSVFGLKTCAARVFSAYGAGLRRQILWDVCEKASTGTAVHLFGTGDETRDFVHAADVAFALRTLVERAPAAGEAYNVASGAETRISDLAKALVAQVAPGAVLEFSGESRPGDPLRWRGDASAIRALGFEPRVSLEEGVVGYASWYLAEGRSHSAEGRER